MTAQAGEFKVPPFDKTKREHYWIVMLTYHVKPQSGEFIELNENNLVSTSMIGCYYCQEPYTEKSKNLACEYKE